RSCCWTAYDKSDDIDEKSSDCQHAEKQRLRESNPEESIQGIASRSYQSDCQGYGQQRQRKLQAALAVPETVFPMGLDDCHEHRAEGSGCPQGCQEPERER